MERMGREELESCKMKRVVVESWGYIGPAFGTFVITGLEEGYVYAPYVPRQLQKVKFPGWAGLEDGFQKGEFVVRETKSVADAPAEIAFVPEGDNEDRLYPTFGLWDMRVVDNVDPGGETFHGEVPDGHRYMKVRIGPSRKVRLQSMSLAAPKDEAEKLQDWFDPIRDPDQPDRLEKYDE